MILCCCFGCMAREKSLIRIERANQPRPATSATTNPLAQQNSRELPLQIVINTNDSTSKDIKKTIAQNLKQPNGDKNEKKNLMKPD